jgi:hypothetical protein
MAITDAIAAIKAHYSNLNRLLITKYPFLWQTQIHLVLFYALAFGLVAFIGGLCYPINFQELCAVGGALTKAQYNITALCISGNLIFLIYWRKRINLHKNKDFSWRSSFLEAGIYLVGILLLWTSSNMFNLGLNTKVAYFTLKGESGRKERLLEKNYFITGYLPHADSQKVAHIDQYYANGEHLLHQLYRHVFDLGEPELATKTYHEVNNDYNSTEVFFNRRVELPDSMTAVELAQQVLNKPDLSPSEYQFTRKFIKKNLKNPFYWKNIQYKLEYDTVQNLDNAIYVDTLLTNRLYGGLRYRFDEFVPKIHHDNYKTLFDRVPFNQLSYGSYSQLLNNLDPFPATVLYEDFARSQRTKKPALAKYFFLNSLTLAERRAYSKLTNKILQVFNNGTDISLIECALMAPVTPAMVKGVSDKGKVDPNNFEDPNQYNLNSELRDALKIAEKATLELRAHVVERANQDSVELSQAFQLFHRSLHQEARFWHNEYLREIRNNFAAALRSSRRENRMEFTTITFDSIFAHLPYNFADSLISHRAFGLWNNRSRQIDNQLNDFRLEMAKTVVEAKLPLLSYLFSDEPIRKFKYDSEPYLCIIYNNNNNDRRRGAQLNIESMIASDRHRGYLEKCYFNEHVRNIILRLVVPDLFPPTPDHHLYWQPYLSESTIRTVYLGGDYQYLGHDDLVISNPDEDILKKYNIKVVNLDKRQLEQEMKTCAALMKSKIESDAALAKRLEKMSSSVQIPYQFTVFSEKYLSDTALFWNGLSPQLQPLEKAMEKIPEASRILEQNLRFKKLDLGLFRNINHYNYYNYFETEYNDGENLTSYENFKIGSQYLPDLLHYKRFIENHRGQFSADDMQFFAENGFAFPDSIDRLSFTRYIYYHGLDMSKGIREVYRARKYLHGFFGNGVFQGHILSLLVFISALLFFTVSVETRVITAAFALAFLVLILLNFFLGTFYKANDLSTAAESFPTFKQKIVFGVILIPLIFSIVSLLVQRSRAVLPGFLMNMVVVFALSLLTTNPNLYYGENLQKVESPQETPAQGDQKPITQYDLFYYLTLYLGLAVTAGSVLLRYNQSLPERKR